MDEIEIEMLHTSTRRRFADCHYIAGRRTRLFNISCKLLGQNRLETVQGGRECFSTL